MGFPKLTVERLKKKTRRYEDIVQLLIGKIESGELKAGDRLPTERDLVDILGVSRTSIREALRAMELLGMVQSKVGGGTFVRHSGIDGSLLHFADNAEGDDARALETYEVRMLLESYSARLAARNRTEKHLEQMREAMDAMRSDIAQGNRALSPDNQFHRIIAEAAGNGMLLSILSLCAETINSSIAVANAYVNTQDIIVEHEEMHDAIAHGDEKRAERLMRAHIKRAYQRTEFVLKNKKTTSTERDAKA